MHVFLSKEIASRLLGCVLEFISSISEFSCLFQNLCVGFFPQWPYGDICGISPVGKGQGTEFNLTFRKSTNKRSETLKFSTEHRTELLTEALVRTNTQLRRFTAIF